MNFIVLVEKKRPTAPPLVFVVPDTCEFTAAIVKTLPEKLENKYFFHTVQGDQPTVCSSVNDIIRFMKDDELRS